MMNIYLFEPFEFWLQLLNKLELSWMHDRWN